MNLFKTNPTTTEAWKMLLKKGQDIGSTKIIDLFDSSNNRLEKFSIEFDKFF